MRFVCAVDHSEPSLQAAKFAVELAEKCGAELTLVSVVRLPDGEQYGITEYLESAEFSAIFRRPVAARSLRATAP